MQLSQMDAIAMADIFSAARELSFASAPFPMRVSCNGQTSTGFERNSSSPPLPTAPAYGGGMKIAPQAKPTNGPKP